MKDYNTVRLVIGLLVVFIAVVIFLNHTVLKKTKKIDAKFMTRSAIFGAMATLLYIIPIFNISLPFFPEFLKVHIDEVPLLIAGFAYGPLSAILGLTVKTLIKLPMTFTMGVGELADFIYSFVFIIVSSLIYKKHRNMKGALVALLLGTIAQIVAASFITTFLILDFYMQVVGLPEFVIMAQIKAAGIKIDNLRWPFLFAVGIPFNAFKDFFVVLFTLLLYKRLHHFVERVSK